MFVKKRFEVHVNEYGLMYHLFTKQNCQGVCVDGGRKLYLFLIIASSMPLVTTIHRNHTATNFFLLNTQGINRRA